MLVRAAFLCSGIVAQNDSGARRYTRAQPGMHEQANSGDNVSSLLELHGAESFADILPRPAMLLGPPKKL